MYPENYTMTQKCTSRAMKSVYKFGKTTKLYLVLQSAITLSS